MPHKCQRPIRERRVKDLNAAAEIYEAKAKLKSRQQPEGRYGPPLPCGRIRGMPVGMMLIGRHGEDATVLRAAHAFEQA